MSAARITLRAVQPGDDAFLAGLYETTRREEFAALGWPAEQLTAFLGLQYRARCSQYAHDFPHAEDRVVLLEGQPAGRLLVERAAERTTVVDIALLPEARCQGVGTRLLDGLIGEAAALGKPLALSVVAGGPAERLYRRLGFVPVATAPPYLSMELAPPVTRTGGPR